MMKYAVYNTRFFVLVMAGGVAQIRLMHSFLQAPLQPSTVVRRMLFETQILNLASNSQLKVTSLTSSSIEGQHQMDERLSPPFSTVWSNTHHNVLAFGNEDGRLEILKNVESEFSGDSIDDELEEVTCVHGWAAHNNALFDVVWKPDDSQICTASADTTCKLWDVETSVMMRNLTGHSASVKSAAFDPLNPHILAAGGRDNVITLWDTRFENTIGKTGMETSPIVTIHAAHGEPFSTKRRSSPSLNATVTSVIFLKNGTPTIVSTGASDSSIKYWDIRFNVNRPIHMSTPIAAFNPVQYERRSFGYNCVKLNPAGNRLYVCCSNDHIYEFDPNTLHQTNTFTSPSYESSSFYIKIDISVCGNFVASGSKDGDVHIWQVQDESQQAILKGHRAEVTSVSWSKKEFKLSTCSDDMSVRVWRTSLSEANKSKFRQDPYYGFAERLNLPHAPPSSESTSRNVAIIEPTPVLCSQIRASDGQTQEVAEGSKLVADLLGKENVPGCQLQLPQKRLIQSNDDRPKSPPVATQSSEAPSQPRSRPASKNRKSISKTRPTTILQFFKKK